MSKWFSIDGIKKEIKRVRWSNKKKLAENFARVLIFCAFFGIFFVVCEYAITLFLKLIGIGA